VERRDAKENAEEYFTEQIAASMWTSSQGYAFRNGVNQ
jgi:hypothetical protein